MGRFPFNHKFRLELSSDNLNGRAFSRVSGKEENLARYTEIFGNFFLGIYFPLGFLPGISGILS